MIKNNDVGERLRQFAVHNYGTLAEFARKLGKDPTYLTPYINGSSLPGNKLQSELRELGCDVGWLMTGKATPQDNGLTIFYSMPGFLSEEGASRIKALMDEIAAVPEDDRDQVIDVIHQILVLNQKR